MISSFIFSYGNSEYIPLSWLLLALFITFSLIWSFYYNKWGRVDMLESARCSQTGWVWAMNRFQHTASASSTHVTCKLSSGSLFSSLQSFNRSPTAIEAALAKGTVLTVPMCCRGSPVRDFSENIIPCFWIHSFQTNAYPGCWGRKEKVVVFCFALICSKIESCLQYRCSVSKNRVTENNVLCTRCFIENVRLFAY